MKYTKIKNIDEENNESQNSKKNEVIDSTKENIEIYEKTKKIKIYNNSNNKGDIILIILLNLFLFLILVYQNKISNYQNINNKLISSGEKEDLILKHAEKTKDKNEPIIIEKNELILDEKIPLHRDIYKIERFPSMKSSFKKSKKFLKNCIDGIIFRKISSLPIKNPIASSIIPVYNGKNYISKAIKSIQNQNISNLEIILVDDQSTDDSLSFITKLQKSDQRIKIISNKKNMGILYTRCIGALFANGKYIFPLDDDDMFLDEDVFQTITNIAEKGYFDIVEFRAIESKRGTNNILNNEIGIAKFTNLPLNMVLYQPYLGNIPISQGKKLNSFGIEVVYLWAKCIKAEIYKKTINKLGIEKYSTHIIRYEDIIFNYALFNTASSYKLVGKYGILKIERQDSASRNKNKIVNLICHIFYLDIMTNFVQDKKENKIALVNMVLKILTNIRLRLVLNNNKNIKKSLISSIDKVLKMTKISDDLINKIRKIGKQLKYINYEF